MIETRKCIFITGAASGIGRATAELFANKGWMVGAYDVSEEGLAKLEQELGSDNCITEMLDVTDRANWPLVLARFAERSDGKLDVLFNNAGIGIGGMLADFSLEDMDRIIDVNFKGVLNGIHFALPLLKETTGALCFTTSSSSAIFGAAGLAMYSATKHAVKGLTEALSVEFAMIGVRAADTLPGIVDTAIWDIMPGAIDNAAKEGPWRAIPPSEVAEAVWAAYHGNKLHYYVPEDLEPLETRKANDPAAIRDAFLSGKGWQ